MYIIVVGGGKIGFYLASALLGEGHEVLVLEKDSQRCGFIGDQLGSVACRGDGCEARTLAEVGTERADVFVAVTDEDEDNLVACQVAKHKFKVGRTIARINNPNNKKLFKTLGIDVTVSSTDLIMEHIEEEVPTHSLVHLMTLEEGVLELVELKVPEDSSAVGKRVGDLPIPCGTRISLVVGREGPQVPSEDTVIEAGARLVAVVRREDERGLKAAVK
ncbi:MAG: TrkA family potassium uptake protein [Chloroflexota bacterium]|nr:TrkA family potassium uptake protein [Chloroflexota bacterium]